MSEPAHAFLPSGDRPQPRITVRLGQPAELAAATPYLLGFRPRESLVAIGLHAPRSRCGLVMRADLPPRSDEAEVARTIGDFLARDGADEALLVVHTEEADPAGIPPGRGRVRHDLARSRLVRLTRRGLRRHGVPLREAILVRDGWWTSYVCADPACCPPEGAPIPDDACGELAAASAFTGMAVLDSREDLYGLIAPTGFLDGRAVEIAVDHELSRVEAGGAFAGVELVGEVDRRLRHGGDGGDRALDADRVAALGVALMDPILRDNCLRTCFEERGEAVESLWLELVRRLPVPFDAAPATLLAMTAYNRGDGAFARICLTRAIESCPDCTLAVLLADLLDRAVPPWTLAAALVGAGEHQWPGR